MRTHQELDARTLDMHRLVAEKIRRDPALFEEAKEILARWRTFVHPNSQPYLMEWERLMEQGIDACLAVALEESEHATALRQSSPLTCVLPNEERLIFLAQWNARQRGEGHKSGTLSLLEDAIFQQDFRVMEKRLAVWLMAHGEPSEASGLMERLPEEKARIFAGFLQWAAHGDWIPLSSVEPALAIARGRGLYDPAKLDIFECWGTDWRFDWHRMWQRQWEMVWRPPASKSKPAPGLLYATCGGIVVTLHPEVNARAVEKRMEAGTLRTAILGAIPAAGVLRRDVVAVVTDIPYDELMAFPLEQPAGWQLLAVPQPHQPEVDAFRERLREVGNRMAVRLFFDEVTGEYCFRPLEDRHA